MIKFIKLLLIGFVVALVGQANAQGVWREGEFRGVVILTVTGNVGLPTRSASNADTDKFFRINGITFEIAAQFDYAA